MQGNVFDVFRAVWLAAAWGIPAILVGLLAVFVAAFPLLTLAGFLLRLRDAIRNKGKATAVTAPTKTDTLAGPVKSLAGIGTGIPRVAQASLPVSRGFHP